MRLIKARYRWVLFGIALLFLQCRRQTQFTTMLPGQTGVAFRNEISETQHNNILTYEYTYNGGGVAVADINNDGLTDLYFSGNAVANKLYINKGNWKFEDITRQSNTAGRTDWKTGVTFADVNGDGWQDLYVCYSGNAAGEGFNKPVIRDHPKRANQLFINQGCATGGVPAFKEQAKQYGLDAPGTFSTQSYFFDYDRDGDLDMFLLNHANMFYAAFFNVKRLRNLRHPYFGNKLYRNDNGSFVEISQQAGIHGSGLNFGLSAAISDLNFDGWPDIYVTNDYEEQDFCYINNGNGTFKEVSKTLFAHLSKYGMGSDIADINNDGLPDIFVADMLPEDNHRQKLLRGQDEYDKYSLSVDSGYHHQYMRNTLQVNCGFAADSLPRFSEIGQLAGVSNTDWSWAPLITDFDNDGLKDIFITNGYLRDVTNLDFIKYIMNDAASEANAGNRPPDLLATVQRMPSTKLTKYIFANTDGIHFTNKTEAWGLTQKAISNAAVYADLDNDGDHDLVVSNLNDEVSLLQNHQEKIQKNNYIKIKLAGRKPNTAGIGARVWVMLEDKTLYHEAHFGRGYQSGVEPLFTIGVGTAAIIKEIRVQWPDQTTSLMANVKPNQLVVVEQAATGAAPVVIPRIQTPLLREVTEASHLDFRHIENRYVDFKFQRLVPYQLSRLGGKLAVADVNNDGNDDVFFGAASGQCAQLYYGTDEGRFTKAGAQPWQHHADSEDAGMAFFDADGDGDADLYVVSGGNEFAAGDPYYQDRLYRNDGGVFTMVLQALPRETTSGSCVVAADFDKDGDLDLFVGGRLAAQNYPLYPKSYLLRNDSHSGIVRFTDVTDEACKNLQQAGMVTAATWTDIDNDTWPDLVVTGEWMPVRIFKNNKGVLTETTDAMGLAETQGWWSSIKEADVDGDGDSDFLLGNAGLNMQLRASAQEPLTCYMQDINSDGAIDPIICYYIQGKSYPLASRDELLEQVTPLRKKFIKYADYADATIENILTEEQLASARVLKAVTLRSSWLENTGHGKFLLKALPELAQVSMINAFVQHDVDGDGKTEIVAAGNFYPYRVQLGRSDAAMGVLLKFSEGQARVYKSDTPLWLTGDIRDMAVVKFSKAAHKIVVSRNNDAASVFEVANFQRNNDLAKKLNP